MLNGVCCVGLIVVVPMLVTAVPPASHCAQWCCLGFLAVVACMVVTAVAPMCYFAQWRLLVGQWPGACGPGAAGWWWLGALLGPLVLRLGRSATPAICVWRWVYVFS